MPKEIATKTEKTTYIKCKKCGTEVFWNTKRNMTPCKCGAIEVDGCEEYVRVIGKKEDYEEVEK